MFTMIFSFLSALLLFVLPLPLSAFLHGSDGQSVIGEHVDREKVPGVNPAYYTGPKRDDQLFDIGWFQVAPDPPTRHVVPNNYPSLPLTCLFRNKQVFFYLNGKVGDQPGLDNATLLVRAWIPNDPKPPIPWEAEAKLSEFAPVVVRRYNATRRNLDYGGPLKKGENEMLFDWPLVGPFIHTGNHTYEAVAWLPDGGVLFSFKGTYWLEGGYGPG